MLFSYALLGGQLDYTVTIEPLGYYRYYYIAPSATGLAAARLGL